MAELRITEANYRFILLLLMKFNTLSPKVTLSDLVNIKYKVILAV